MSSGYKNPRWHFFVDNLANIVIYYKDANKVEALEATVIEQS